MGTLKQRCGGYTLVEMVVTAALVGILSVGIVSVFISTIQGGKTARAQANVKTQGDYVISTMERSLRNAVKLPVCSPGNDEITFSYVDDTKQEVIQTYRFLDEAIEVEKDGVSQGLIVSSGQQANAIRVTQASFTCTVGDSFNPGYVSIVLTLETVGDKRQQTRQQFQTTVAMRNIP